MNRLTVCRCWPCDCTTYTSWYRRLGPLEDSCGALPLPIRLNARLQLDPCTKRWQCAHWLPDQHNCEATQGRAADWWTGHGQDRHGEWLHVQVQHGGAHDQGNELLLHNHPIHVPGKLSIFSIASMKDYPTKMNIILEQEAQIQTLCSVKTLGFS